MDWLIRSQTLRSFVNGLAAMTSGRPQIAHRWTTTAVFKRIALLATALSAVAPFAALFAFSAGPPPGSSGVPAAGNNQAGNTCDLCHSDSEGGQAGKLNPDELGKIELTGLPKSYVPGKSYSLEVHVSHPTAIRWGFQLTAV